VSSERPWKRENLAPEPPDIASEAFLRDDELKARHFAAALGYAPLSIILSIHLSESGYHDQSAR
jgi:hypothetical protein